MKINKFIILVTLFLVFLGVVVFNGKARMDISNNLASPLAAHPDHHTQLPASSYEQAIASVDQASEHRMQGDLLSKQGRNDAAAEEYKKAYLIDKGSRAVSGLLLAMEYEKLGRYGEGIALLDQMTERGELSQKGTQNANEIKSRLIAAKSHASQTQPTQNS